MTTTRRLKILRRAGMSLIEVLVVISVIGLLAALLISAVQSARAGAARAACANNLHQLGIALAAYATDFGTLPPACGLQTASLHTAILPYLELTALYNSVNISTGSLFVAVENRTAALSTPSFFVCPSDPSSAQRENGLTSYAGNAGWGRQKGVFGFSTAGPVRLSECTDGTSQTAAMSEWLLGAWSDADREPRRAVFATSAFPDYNHFAEACRTINASSAELAGLSSKGLNWMRGDFGWTFYNHCLGPNQPSCTNGTGHQDGAWTATSAHPGGVNLLFLDGHCRFIGDQINISVWRAISSRDGGEVFSDSDL